MLFPAPSKVDRVPDPGDDEVAAIFYSFQDSRSDAIDATPLHCGIIAVEGAQLNGRRLRAPKVEYVESELELLNRIIDVVVDIDPDILSGWEVQAASWGYLSARGRVYGKWSYPKLSYIF